MISRRHLSSLKDSEDNCMMRSTSFSARSCASLPVAKDPRSSARAGPHSQRERHRILQEHRRKLNVKERRMSAPASSVERSDKPCHRRLKSPVSAGRVMKSPVSGKSTGINNSSTPRFKSATRAQEHEEMLRFQKLQAVEFWEWEQLQVDLASGRFACSETLFSIVAVLLLLRQPHMKYVIQWCMHECKRLCAAPADITSRIGLARARLLQCNEQKNLRRCCRSASRPLALLGSWARTLLEEHPKIMLSNKSPHREQIHRDEANELCDSALDKVKKLMDSMEAQVDGYSVVAGGISGPKHAAYVDSLLKENLQLKQQLAEQQRLLEQTFEQSVLPNEKVWRDQHPLPSTQPSDESLAAEKSATSQHSPRNTVDSQPSVSRSSSTDITPCPLATNACVELTSQIHPVISPSDKPILAPNNDSPLLHRSVSSDSTTSHHPVEPVCSPPCSKLSSSLSCTSLASPQEVADAPPASDLATPRSMPSLSSPTHHSSCHSPNPCDSPVLRSVWSPRQISSPSGLFSPSQYSPRRSPASRMLGSMLCLPRMPSLPRDHFVRRMEYIERPSGEGIGEQWVDSPSHSPSHQALQRQVSIRLVQPGAFTRPSDTRSATSMPSHVVTSNTLVRAESPPCINITRPIIGSRSPLLTPRAATCVFASTRAQLSTHLGSPRIAMRSSAPAIDRALSLQSPRLGFNLSPPREESPRAETDEPACISPTSRYRLGRTPSDVDSRLRRYPALGAEQDLSHPNASVASSATASALNIRQVIRNLKPAQEKQAHEPAQEEQAQIEPTQEELAQIEPAQEEQAQIEPVQEELAQIEPAQEELMQIEPAQEEQAQIEPAQEELAQIEPAQENLVQNEPASQDTEQREIFKPRSHSLWPGNGFSLGSSKFGRLSMNPRNVLQKSINRMSSLPRSGSQYYAPKIQLWNAGSKSFGQDATHTQSMVLPTPLAN